MDTTTKRPVTLESKIKLLKSYLSQNKYAIPLYLQKELLIKDYENTRKLLLSHKFKRYHVYDPLTVKEHRA